MSGFEFDEVGEFGSTQDAEQWARDNNVDLRDIDVQHRGGRKRLYVRRGATRMSDIELRNSRDRGFL
jgi:hypothetical protein